MAGEIVHIGREPGWSRITLRGPRGNAVGTDMIEELSVALPETAGDPGCAGVLLTAEGSLFCPGLDLAEVLEFDREEMSCFIGAFTSLVREMYAFPKPLVCAIEGHALAGGMLVALTADWRVIGEHTLIGLNELKVGVPLPYAMARLVAATVPRSLVSEVALLGANVPGERAVQNGLAQECAPAAEVEKRAIVRLRTFLERDPDAFATTKRFLREPVIAEMEAGDELHRDRFLDVWFSPASRLRLQAAHESLFGAKPGVDL